MTSLIYLDSSALLKRVFVEPESESFAAAFDEAQRNQARFIASALARVEVARAARARIDSIPPGEVATATNEAFFGVAIADLSTPILESARIIGPPVLRALDAIHIATAVASGADAVWTYDRRLASVAAELGISAVAPS